MTTTLSDAGRALAFLSTQLDGAEMAVSVLLRDVLTAQEALRKGIAQRDAVQQALNLTAQYVARETK
jgi:hypothetical protein